MQTVSPTLNKSVPVCPTQALENAFVRQALEHVEHLLMYVLCHSWISTYNQAAQQSKYTECNRRNGPDFGSVFLRSYYTDITQNIYIQSSMVTEILAREV